MTTALGVAPDSDGSGVTPLTHRRTQMYQWENTGVVGGLEVSPTTGLSYEVAAGMAITSRGDSDGYALAYSEGGTVETEAASSSNPRIDAIWIRSNDLSQGDETNEVELGVTQGSASSSPSVPSIPAGATLIETWRMPAGASSTEEGESVNEYDYAIPYGASMGLLASVNADATGWAGDLWDMNEDDFVTLAQTGQFYVPTDRNIEVVYDFRAKLAVDDADFKTYGSVFIRYTLDGVADAADYLGYDDEGNTVYDEQLLTHCWLRHQCIYNLSVEKGYHYVGIQGKANDDNDGRTNWCGMNRIYVYDRGVAN